MSVMEPSDVKALSKKTVSLLRVSPDEWEAIAETRNQGIRFSLNFSHKMAREGKRGGIVLISTTGPDSALRIGLIRSIAATSTLDSRVVFDLVDRITPDSLTGLLERVIVPGLRIPRDRLTRSTSYFEHISPKLGAALISEVAKDPENTPPLTRILAHLRQPTRYDNARALQKDAVELAIRAFSDNKDGAVSIALPGKDTAIATVRVLEDTAIEHDARWMPGWRLADSDLTGRATFKRQHEELEVFTANKRPLEKLFGVDLIYLNKARGALVMVQYKMLEPEGRTRPHHVIDKLIEHNEMNDQEWVVRINDQFKEELSRMHKFDGDLSPDGPYRLNSGAFFFKLVRRNAAVKSAGILLSLGHLDQLMNEGNLIGPAGGLRISYRSLDGHYLRSDGFVELVRSGYVGTRGATTDHMQCLIEASLRGGNAVVAAIQSALKLGTEVR